MTKNDIVIYKSDDGSISIDVNLESETVWLTQSQMVTLYDRDQSVIARHIRNIFKEEELEEKSNMHFLHIANSDKPVKAYSLDVIISVGYRVKSLRGTQFRMWANKILKDYLVKGYAINQKIKAGQFYEMKSAMQILSKVIQNQSLSADESHGLLQVITDYTYALDTLDRYDNQKLYIDSTTASGGFVATYENAINAIEVLRRKFGGSTLFANEKDESFKSSINTIYQTFDGKEFYPSIEEKSSMLLYLIVKNHSFSDGNKRIAAFIFIWFLEKNGILYKSNGGKLLDNNTLVALTLMIAESDASEKDTMVKLIVNLINKNNI